MNDKDRQKVRRILIVDDNKAIHADFRKVLMPPAVDTESLDEERELFGDTKGLVDDFCFELDSAYQGQEALEMLQESWVKERPYAMAFVDVRMPPGWDGIETILRLWQIDPFLHVVICTAYSDYGWHEMIEKLGRNDRTLILKKPFDNIEVCQLALTLTEKWELGLLEWCKLNNARQEATKAKRALKISQAELAKAQEAVAERAEALATN